MLRQQNKQSKAIRNLSLLKFIKFSKTSLKENYVEYIDEPITSIQIGLTIPTAYNYSPYLANFKLCLGKQVPNV